MASNKVEIKTDNVELLIGTLELLKNKDYLGQTVLGPNESLDLIINLKDRKLLRLSISKRTNPAFGYASERDQRVISISTDNRSSMNEDEGIVVVFDYGQKYLDSIKSIKEAVGNKLTEIKKGIENSMS